MEKDWDACLLLETDDGYFGLDLGAVEAVIPYRAPWPVPYQDSDKFGALLYRGRFMGVADLGRILGAGEPKITERSVIVVAKADDSLMGLVVAASRGIIRNLSELPEVRVFGKWEGPFVRRAVKSDGKTVNILSLEGIAGFLSGGLEMGK